jgi:hypothetical protein
MAPRLQPKSFRGFVRANLEQIEEYKRQGFYQDWIVQQLGDPRATVLALRDALYRARLRRQRTQANARRPSQTTALRAEDPRASKAHAGPSPRGRRKESSKERTKRRPRRADANPLAMQPGEEFRDYCRRVKDEDIL